MYEVSVFGAHQSDTALAVASVDEAFHHSSTVVTDIASAMAFCMLLCMVDETFCICTNLCTLLGASSEDEVSTCIRTWRKRLKGWYKDTVFKPPSHGLGWRGLLVLQMTLLPNWCLTVGLFDVKRERIVCRRQNFWHKLWAMRLMADRAMLTVSHFSTLYFTNEEFCISRKSHFLGDISTAEKHSSKIPCQGVESHPVRA